MNCRGKQHLPEQKPARGCLPANGCLKGLGVKGTGKRRGKNKNPAAQLGEGPLSGTMCREAAEGTALQPPCPACPAAFLAGHSLIFVGISQEGELV